MGLQTGACEERMMSKMTGTPISDYFFWMSSVKFIARMQWVVCAAYHSTCIAVFTYADNGLTEIKRFQAGYQLDNLKSLAVHPTLPYLLSSSEGNFIQLWDWDKGWICIRKFKCSCADTRRSVSFQMTFDPKDAYSFASLNYSGDINVCRSLQSFNFPYYILYY